MIQAQIPGGIKHDLQETTPRFPGYDSHWDDVINIKVMRAESWMAKEVKTGK